MSARLSTSTQDELLSPRPRLVLRFVLVAAIGLIATAIAIILLVNHAFGTRAEQEAKDLAHHTMGVLRSDVRAEDFTGALSPARERQLDALVARLSSPDSKTSIALYGPDGVASYASPGAQSAPLSSDLVRQVFSGGETGAISSNDDGSHILITSMAVRSSDGAPLGLAEIRSNYEPIAAAARSTSLKVAAILLGLLALLFAVIVPVLGRTADRLRRHAQELEHLATHDELTKLLNRIGFRRELDAALKQQSVGVLLLIDLDGFQDVNNMLGAPAGDEVLSQVAHRLELNTENARLGRLGEDEFGVLLSHCEQADVDKAATAITQALMEPLSVNNVRIAIEPRVGATTIHATDADPDQVLRKASIALTLAKEEHQALQMFEPAIDVADKTRLSLTADLREALASGQLLLHYQPQADLTTRAIRGVEALVRWHHPTRGLMTPSEFIPLAERAGLIGQIDRYVLQQAISDWQMFSAQGIELDLGVNLSPVDLLDRDFSSYIDLLLDAHAFPRDRLVLELTERTLIRDERRVQEALSRLAETGARLSVDDFGTGYSSLAYLYRYPMRQVKLDRTFIANLPDDTASQAVIRSTVELAHSLGATVVAEGVETTAQWEHLRDACCDVAQGFLVGKPQRADELVTALTHDPTRPTLVAA